jgi:hypothetical protein
VLDVLAECGNVQSIFMRRIGFGFRYGLRRADEFLNFVFFVMFRIVAFIARMFVFVFLLVRFFGGTV